MAKELNLYRVYIKAWSNYEEGKVMMMLEEYMGGMLEDTLADDWYNIRYFHENYSIHDGYYYEVDEDYAIGNVNSGEVIWKGDYPTVEILKNIIDGKYEE